MIAELKPYEDYTGTEQTWLGKIPSHWELSRLGARLFERRETNENNEIQDVLSVMKGRGVIPYAEKGNVGNKRSDDIRRYKIVRPNDIVINCMNVIIGSLGISKYTGCLSPVYYVLRTRFSDDVPRYFNAVFQSPNFHRSLVRIGNGILAHRMRIPMEKLKCEMIPIPPPDEQALIVRFLDWASVRLGKAIAAKRKVIGLLEEQKQAIIQRAVTRGLDDTVPLKPSGLDWLGDVPEHWEVAPLRSRMRIQRGRFLHRPRNDPRFYGGPFPFIQTGDIARATKNIKSHSQTLNAAGYQISRMFPKGTLAMVITGAKTGHVAILGFDACFPDSAVGFVPAKSVDTEYLYFLFHALKAELDRASITSTQENLNVGRIGRQVAPWPPLDEQLLIIEQLNAELRSIDDAIDVRKREITLLLEYRTRLIADVVTGKLDVREFARTLPADISEEAAELASSELGDDQFSESNDELADELAGEPA